MPTCLLIDESAVIRKVLRKMLDLHGLDAMETDHPDDGLTLMKKSWFDVIFIDWTISDYSAMEFLLAARKVYITRWPKIIFMVTEYHDTEVNQALHAGAFDYIMKPFDREMVDAALKKAQLLPEWA